MVSWIEREELVSYDEIDDFIKELEKTLVKYCCSHPPEEKLSMDGIVDIAGRINALEELKVIHHNNFKQYLKQHIPPDPLGYV